MVRCSGNCYCRAVDTVCVGSLCSTATQPNLNATALSTDTATATVTHATVGVFPYDRCPYPSCGCVEVRRPAPSVSPPGEVARICGAASTARLRALLALPTTALPTFGRNCRKSYRINTTRGPLQDKAAVKDKIREWEPNLTVRSRWLDLAGPTASIDI